MKRQFAWQDISKHLSNCPEGRTRDALTRLLKGERVDIGQYTGNPSSKTAYRRNPSFFRNKFKKLLSAHTGISIEGNVVYIPDLQKPRSFLRDV